MKKGKDLRILVTGGAGFVGSHLVESLILAGHDVHALDNLSQGSLENVDPRAHFHQADICDPEQLAQVFSLAQPEAVFHYAAQTSVQVSIEDPGFDAQTNVIGTLNVVRGAVRCGSRRLIYASAGGAVYGDPKYVPVDEEHPTCPLCPYATSKLVGEHYVKLYHHLSELEYVVLRFTNIYGPRQRFSSKNGAVAVFLGQLLSGKPPGIFGDGSNTRDFLYVTDAVSAAILALESQPNLTLNIGTTRPVSILGIARRLQDLLDTSQEVQFHPARKGEVRHIALDPSRARQALGWEAQVCLEEGLQRVVKWKLSQSSEKQAFSLVAKR